MAFYANPPLIRQPLHCLDPQSCPMLTWPFPFTPYAYLEFPHHTPCSPCIHLLIMSQVHLSFIHPSCPIQFENRKKLHFRHFGWVELKKYPNTHHFFAKSVSFAVHSIMSLLCSLAFCHSGGAPVDYRWQHFFATKFLELFLSGAGTPGAKCKIKSIYDAYDNQMQILIQKSYRSVQPFP